MRLAQRQVLWWIVGAATLVFAGWKCPFFAVTGHYCPGCGTVRAVSSLAGGDPISALQSNALTLLVLPVVMFGVLVPRSRIGRAIAGNQRVVIAVAIIVTVSFTVARNTVAPWLAPVG